MTLTLSPVRPSTTGVDATGEAPTATDRLARRRRTLQIALGLVWLLDAVLQYQPYMFTRAFPTEQLGSTAAGNPGFLAGPITWASGQFAAHVAIADTASATLQLAIAIGILWPRTVRWALGTSIVWALAVWWLGEGFGGVLTGATSPFMGAPGAAVLYAFLAVLLWPGRRPDPASATAGRAERRWDSRSVATAGPLPPELARLGWASLFAALGWMAIQPANRAPTSLRAMVSGMAIGEPAWIRGLDHALATALADRGTAVSMAFAALCALAAGGVFSARAARVAVVTAAALAVAIWLGEDFGQLFTGQATDPDTGPLLLLLALAFWPLPARAVVDRVADRGTGRPAGPAGRPVAPAPSRPLGTQ